MNSIRWTTVIEELVDGKWVKFSQQATIEGKETPMSDAAYLDACLALGHTNNSLRIKPSKPVLSYHCI
jgi:hypothetical protein